MPPKNQSKADLAKKQKVVEDKMLGWKNKSKSKNVQKYVQSLQHAVQPKPNPSKIATKKKNMRKRQDRRSSMNCSRLLSASRKFPLVLIQNLYCVSFSSMDSTRRV
jgi:hypothetical protein